MLPKEERKAMLLRLYNDDSELIDHSKNRNRGLNQNGAKTEANNEKAAAAVPDLEEQRDDNSIADGNDVPMGDCGVDTRRENETEFIQINENQALIHENT
jgi:multisite-specific tRNA:(cytosine-C5)-methyltransferase